MADRFVEMTALHDEHADSIKLQLGMAKAGQNMFIMIESSQVLSI